MRLFVLIATICIPLMSVAVAPRCGELFSESPAQAIFDSVKGIDRDLIRKDSFETSRGLSDYGSDLSSEFISNLDQLRATDLWIDFGAGKALAAEDYLTINSKNVHPNAKVAFPFRLTEDRASVLAISYKYSRWWPKYRGSKLQIIKDKFFEELTTLPKYQLGSDDFGVFSYTSRLHYYLDLSLQHLEVGRKLYIRTNFNRTAVITKSGEKISVVDWVKKISGVDVQFRNHSLLIITKASSEVKVPSLKVISYKEEMPPYRVFAED